MKPLFHSTIVQIGDLVNDFLQESTLILFDHDVPAELHDMAVLHTKSESTEPVQAGDYLCIGEHRWRVTSVGDRANETLLSIGHCTLKADGSTEAQLPGMIHLEAAPFPPLTVGSVLAFVRI